MWEMTIKQRLILFAALPTVLVSMFAIVTAPSASALTEQECYEKYGNKMFAETPPAGYRASNCDESKKGKCQIVTSSDRGVKSNVIKCEASGAGTARNNTDECSEISTNLIKCDNNGGDPLTSVVLQVLNFFALGVGLAVVGGIIWGGMLIAGSNGNSSKAKEGINVIVNAIVGLLLFFFMYALVDYLVPGGLL